MFRLTLANAATTAAPTTLPQPDAPSDRTTSLLGSTHLDVLEDAFRAWVTGREKPDVLIVAAGGCHPVPIEHALRRLSTSTQPLAPAPGAALGLCPDATVGTAAAALLQARADPAGPRCRSYRSATYFLFGRALLASDEGR
jgi:hypothetical protein